MNLIKTDLRKKNLQAYKQDNVWDTAIHNNDWKSWKKHWHAPAKNGQPLIAKHNPQEQIYASLLIHNYSTDPLSDWVACLGCTLMPRLTTDWWPKIVNWLQVWATSRRWPWPLLNTECSKLDQMYSKSVTACILLYGKIFVSWCQPSWSIAEKSSNQRNVTILWSINLSDQRAWIF